jgi:hypothetical protein
MRAGCGPRDGCSGTEVGGLGVGGLPGGFECGWWPPGGWGVVGVVVVVVGGCTVVFVGGGLPDAANATAGATVMMTGTLQPAFSSVRRETPPRRSPSSERIGSSILTALTLPPT